MKKILIGLGIFAALIGGLTRLDRLFFKHNDSFCIRFIHSTLAYNPDWEVPQPSEEEKKHIDQILNQPFHYFTKGGQSFAFLSADGQYILKFCRFPSSVRPLSWLSHTFSRLRTHRIQEDKIASKKLHNTFRSFKIAYEELKEETGLLYAHLNASQDLKKTITLIDKMGIEYQVPLDTVSFLLQKKAELIYPTLDQLQITGNNDLAKQAIQQLISLIATSSKKGIVDHDAILRKNYGFTSERAIHIDLGEFAKNEELKHPQKCAAHILEMTASLKKRLENFYPEFLPFYEEEVALIMQIE